MNCGSSGSAGEKVAPAWADSPRAEPGAADPESRSSPAARRPARGQALKGETPWPIWGVERTISGAQSSPHPLILRERSWENLMGGGRGDCSSLARKLPARGQQAGHCGVAAQVTPASDADAWAPGSWLGVLA